MNTKVLEIRDKNTLIAAIGIRMVPHFVPEVGFHALKERQQAAAEQFLLLRSGFSLDQDQQPLVILCRLEASGTDHNATYDPHAWGSRTMREAHLFIAEHWDELESGAVVDVQYILGETAAPKVSERFTQ